MIKMLILVIMIVFSSVSMAQTFPPIPKEKAKPLSVIEDQIQLEKKDKKALEAEIKTLQKDIKTVQNKLVKHTSKLQKLGKEQSELDSDITALKESQAEQKQWLKDNYAQTSRTILALQRIKRVPPTTIMFRPDTPLEIAQANIVLESIMPAMNTRIHELNNTLDELQKTELQLAEKQEKIKITLKSLQDKEREIATLIKKRESLYTNKQRKLRTSKRKIVQLSKDAKNLRDLLKKLEEENKKNKVARKRRQLSAEQIPSTGEAQPPVFGTIWLDYKQTSDIGAIQEGITIETKPNTVIVAPMGGIVRFANRFKHYGEMVIIEHKNGYHSLIGGFSTINTQTGRKVKAGEPIGNTALPSSRQGKAQVYYELRHGGKPVDPATKIKQFKS